MRHALGVVVVVAACGRSAPSGDADLKTYLTRIANADRDTQIKEINSWKLDEQTFGKIVVEPYRRYWPRYAAYFDARKSVLAMQLDEAATITVRKHFAGDDRLTPSQARLRWALPPMFPSMVAESDEQALDTAFVWDGAHWRVLAGLDDVLFERANVLDPVCAKRLKGAGPKGTCSDVAWAVADAALRDDKARFDHACKLAAPHCKLHGLDNLDEVLGAAGVERQTAAIAKKPTLESISCTVPQYKVEGPHGGFIVINEKACHTCTFASETDTSPLIDGFANAIRETPPALLKAIPLSQVTVCSSITGAKGEVSEDSAIGGTIDPQRGGLFLSVEGISISGEEILHHELFHLFDRHQKNLEYVPTDKEWIAIEGGYLNDHAKKNVREDRATVYSFIMTRPQELCDNVAADDAVRKKARLIRQRIRDVIGDEAAKYIDTKAPCLDY